MEKVGVEVEVMEREWRAGGQVLPMRLCAYK